jgi:hypothetical protein
VPGMLYHYLAEDHDRLDALLDGAILKTGEIDIASYSEFRKGLLRHISIEEKIILPAASKWQHGKYETLAKRLHGDHGVLVSLLAPPPTSSIILTIRAILKVHNPLEEGSGGLYGVFEESTGCEMEDVLIQIKAAPPISVLPNNEKPEVLEAAKNAVAAAGYEFKAGL